MLATISSGKWIKILNLWIGKVHYLTQTRAGGGGAGWGVGRAGSKCGNIHFSRDSFHKWSAAWASYWETTISVVKNKPHFFNAWKEMPFLMLSSSTACLLGDEHKEGEKEFPVEYHKAYSQEVLHLNGRKTFAHSFRLFLLSIPPHIPSKVNGKILHSPTSLLNYSPGIKIRST